MESLNYQNNSISEQREVQEQDIQSSERIIAIDQNRKQGGNKSDFQ